MKPRVMVKISGSWSGTQVGRGFSWSAGEALRVRAGHRAVHCVLVREASMWRFFFPNIRVALMGFARLVVAA